MYIQATPKRVLISQSIQFRDFAQRSGIALCGSKCQGVVKLPEGAVGYIEGFRNVEKLRHVAREATERGKPIVTLKVGKAAVGTRAAVLHTGAGTGSRGFYEALFNEIGVLRGSD